MFRTILVFFDRFFGWPEDQIIYGHFGARLSVWVISLVGLIQKRKMLNEKKILREYLYRSHSSFKSGVSLSIRSMADRGGNSLPQRKKNVKKWHFSLNFYSAIKKKVVDLENFWISTNGNFWVHERKKIHNLRISRHRESC